MSDPRTTGNSHARPGNLGFGAAYAALHAGHTVADYWIQTSHQAATKGQPGWPGRRACATHVATLTATQTAYLALAAWTTGTRLNWRQTAAGLAINAASHYMADRRTPLRRLADRLAWKGTDTFYASGEGLASGAAHLDQAWHIGWAAAAAAVIAGDRP